MTREMYDQLQRSHTPPLPPPQSSIPLVSPKEILDDDSALLTVLMTIPLGFLYCLIIIIILHLKAVSEVCSLEQHHCTLTAADYGPDRA